MEFLRAKRAENRMPKLRVADAFDQVADTYDVMVSLNPGYQAHLRLAAEALLQGVRTADPVLLDLGCGSGLSTRALLEAAQRRGMRPRIIGVDASMGMLQQARRHTWPPGVQFLHGRAEELGDLGLPQADGALACYLLRNVTDLVATVAAIHSALRPGAPVVIEEYSVAGSSSAARRWRAVNGMIIRPLAGLIASRPELYDYLHTSVNDFVTIDELADVFDQQSFTGLARRTVGGWQRDILHLLRATA